jgi:hypothetical protein
MPRHRPPPPPRTPDLERLALDLAELLDRVDLSTRYAADDGQRPNVQPRQWTVHGPGLITQLEQAAGVLPAVAKPEGYTDEHGRSLGYRTYVPASALLDAAPVPAHPPRLGSHAKPESRTPGRDEALALLADIETGVADLRYRGLRSLGRKREWRDAPVRRGLRALEHLAGDVDAVLREEVCRAVRQWRSHALVVLAYRDAPARLAKPCPFCGGVVRHDDTGAWCENGEWHRVQGVAGHWSETDWLAVREGRVS